MGDRPDISMTPDEITAFLATQTRAVVSALDGTAPVGTVAALRFRDDGLEVTLRADDEVRALLAADDRVCVIAEQFPSYFEIKAVCAHGRARFGYGPVGAAFRIGLDDVTSFDFAKLPRPGSGSGTET
jgi:hypothetical protein